MCCVRATRSLTSNNTIDPHAADAKPPNPSLAVNQRVRLPEQKWVSLSDRQRLAKAFTSTGEWLCGFHDWDDPVKTCRRLGEYMRKLIFDFDHEFGTRIVDPMRCEFGVLSFPQETYTEDQILDFYDQCQRILKGPQCAQCEFRHKKNQELEAAGIDLYSVRQRERFATYPGYVKQAEWIQKAMESSKAKPTCWYCDRLGDSVIALSAPTNSTILAADKKSFPAFGKILRVDVEMLPSLKELRK